MLGVTVLNTINTHEFHPSVIPGSKFKIPSQYFAVTSLAFLNFCQLLYFYMLLCLHSIIYCKFYTLTNQSLLLWHKYLESLGKSDIFTHVFFQYVMEDEHTKEPSHNNPEEAADYVKAVNLLLQSFVNGIRGFNRYGCQDAYKTFLHTLSQLLSK